MLGTRRLADGGGAFAPELTGGEVPELGTEE